ncbi:MAG: serine/threonine protein kinase [Polyangiaceae bacterium]
MGAPSGVDRAAPSTSSVARVLGRYVLHAELAAGGMATVHLGRLKGEAGFTRTVAIKRLHPQFAKDPEFVAMFVDEARLAARIRHPNVVPTLDVITDGASEGEIFLVMEYVAGESLSRLLRALHAKKRLVPPRIAITLLCGVLHGLHAAHEAKSDKGTPLGIVHRDVSPQNVLVGTDGIAHVLDFGVAKATGRLHTTREGELKGKLAYMAPEQLESGSLTQQSDVYAAAVVLWETLTLRRLFEGDSEGALLMQVLSGKVIPPSKLVPGLPAGIDDIVMRGLARDPSKRWPSARDFAIALERCAPLAPASEIGEWVHSIAGDVLDRRAKLVAEVEGGSMSLPAAAPKESIPGDASSSQVSAIAVSSSESAAPAAQTQRGARGYFFAGALAGLVAVLLVLAFKRGPAPPSPAAAVAPQEAMTVPPPSAPPPTPTGRDLGAPRPPSTGAAEGAAAPTPTGQNGPVDPKASDTAATPASPGWAPKLKPTTPASAPQKPAPKGRAECDPPFTQDSLGHKHYKLQCL